MKNNHNFLNFLNFFENGKLSSISCSGSNIHIISELGLWEDLEFQAGSVFIVSVRLALRVVGVGRHEAAAHLLIRGELLVVEGRLLPAHNRAHRAVPFASGNYSVHEIATVEPTFLVLSPEDVDEEEDDEDGVDQEADGEDVVPAGGGKHLEDEVFVETPFAAILTRFQFGIGIAGQALIFGISGTRGTRVVALHAVS